MHPILFNIGNFPIHTYGVLIAAGFLLAVYTTKQEAIYFKINAKEYVDMCFWCLMIGMLGARILFVITRFEYFLKYPLEIFQVWEGGLVFYGGPILCIPYIYKFCKNRNISLLKMFDICAVGIPIAHSIGRLGCLSTGCCFGRPTGSSWGIVFNTDVVDSHLHGIPLHPTQLYEFAALLVLYFFLKWKIRKKKYDGQITFLYIFLYAFIRTVVEYFRGDDIRGFVIPGYLSTSQFISILSSLIALYFLFRVKKESTK